MVAQNHIQKMKSIIHNGFTAIFGLTIFDLFLVATNQEGLDLLNDGFKLCITIAGGLYFALSIPHKLRMQKIERAKAEEELEKIKRENDEADHKNT